MNFDPIKHKYTDNGREYQSATQFLRQFKKEFDKEKISFHYARKNKREQHEVLDEWALNAECSRDYGNSIHKTVQLYIHHEKEPNQPHLKDVVKEWKKLKLKNVFSEVIVYSEELLVAGTIDIVQKAGKKYNLYDIKTTQDRDKGYGNFLPPFNKIKTTKENEHILQLSFYKHLAEGRGKEIKDLFILYWNGKTFDKVKVNSFDICLIEEK